MPVWRCRECNAHGPVEPQWGPETTDIVTDSHRGQSPLCHHEHGAGAIRLASPPPAPGARKSPNVLSLDDRVTVARIDFWEPRDGRVIGLVDDRVQVELDDGREVDAAYSEIL
jgi:hypothetical protein